MKFLIVALLLSFFTLTQSYAALADVPNKTVSVSETQESVTFSGTAQFTLTDSTSSLFTQAMYGGWLDWENAVLTAYTAAVAGDDVNIFLRAGSTVDLTYIVSKYTQTAFDDVNSATPATWWAFQDTIKQAPSAGAQIYWMRDPNLRLPFKVIEFDGQAGNTIGSLVTWSLVVPKKAGAPRTGAYGVKSTT